MQNQPVDRRTFLATTGAGLTASLVGCSTTPTADPTPPAKDDPKKGPPKIPPSEQVALGFIGLGIRGANLLNRYFLKNPLSRVLAVCDVDETRRGHFQTVVNKHYASNDCKAYTDYRELLARDDIDAVVIATPDHWHVTQCVHAARAGKDIYCEKPLSHTLAEGKLLIDVIQQTGRVFQTGSQQRTEFGQKFVKATEYIRNGRLGRLLSVHVGVGDPPKPCDLPGEDPEAGLDWDRWLGPAPMRPYHSVLSPRGIIRHYPQWRRYREYSCGHLGDMGAHYFDIVQWMLDADTSGPVGVLAPETSTKQRGVRLQYESGLTVTHGGPAGITVVGTRGMMYVNRSRLQTFPADILKEPIGADEFTIPRHKNHGEDWLQCVKSRRTPTCSAEIGVRSAAVCQLANLYYEHRKPFAWDPKEWQFGAGGDPRWLDYQRRPKYRV